MPRLSQLTSIAAGATTDLMATSQYRYLPWRARVRVMLMTTATGVKASVNAGAEQLQPEGDIKGNATAADLPTVFSVDPLDFVAGAGDLIVVNARNTTAGALTVSSIIDINPA
jgi:hypothetical protein